MGNDRSLLALRAATNGDTNCGTRTVLATSLFGDVRILTTDVAPFQFVKEIGTIALLAKATAVVEEQGAIVTKMALLDGFLMRRASAIDTSLFPAEGNHGIKIANLAFAPFPAVHLAFGIAAVNAKGIPSNRKFPAIPTSIEHGGAIFIGALGFFSIGRSSGATT